MSPACMCDWPGGCGGTGTAHCRGCGGDLCVCRCGGERECGGCEMCDFEDDEDLRELLDDRDPDRADFEAARWTCIGNDCCNPHLIHTRDECFTAEMAEQYQGEAEHSDG